MGSGAFGGTYAAPIWHDYMVAAQGSDCPDFPAPQNPVEFSNWSGSHAVSARSTTPGFGGTVQTRAPSAVRPSAPTNGIQPSGGANGKYPPDLYAPGAGQGPAPARAVVEDTRWPPRRRRDRSARPESHMGVDEFDLIARLVETVADARREEPPMGGSDRRRQRR